VHQTKAIEALLISGNLRVEKHQELLASLYDTPGFDANGLTDFYWGGICDILVPGNDKGINKLKEWASLVERMGEGKKYMAVVSATTQSITQHGNLVNWRVGEHIDHAWVRVFIDISPDKIVIGQEPVPTVINTGESKEDGTELVGVIRINQPSRIFVIPGQHDESSTSFDEDPAILELSKSTYDFLSPLQQRQEYQVAHQYIFADTVCELDVKLAHFGDNEGYLFGKLQGIIYENPEYNAWAREIMVTETE
jgi:hypothetical protein